MSRIPLRFVQPPGNYYDLTDEQKLGWVTALCASITAAMDAAFAEDDDQYADEP